MAKAPNIVVVMADQHRADLLGCAGDASARTPNIDRLAREGVRFSRTSCQGPLCMPARASFATERYVRDHGVYTNWSEIASDSPTYMHALRAAGYHTVMLGKAHLYRDETREAKHISELAGHLHRLGFAEVVETGDKFSSGAVLNPYLDMLRERGLLDAYAQHIRDRAYQGEGESGQGATKRVPMWDATPMPLPIDAYIDVWHGDFAARWIEQYDRDQPLYLFVGFPGPHDPWDAPREVVETFADVDVTMPRSTKRPDTDAAGATYGGLLRAFLGLSDTDTMSDDAIRAMRRAYAADVHLIDEGVGKIVAALEATGRLDDTWIVYTSDHGESAGDHGLMSKCVMYRGPVQVPLIVRPPGGREGAVVDALVEHVDLAATLRAIAGAPEISQSEGHSLLGHVDGSSPVQRRDVAISEDWGFASFETERYKLVIDEDALTPAQLFDLVADPAEDDNLLHDPAHKDVVDELMERYARPFLASPPARPTPSIFTGADDPRWKQM